MDKLEDLGVVVLLICILVENSERLDDLQFNFDQAEVLTNVVGAMAETAKLEVSSECGYFMRCLMMAYKTFNYPQFGL